MNKKYVLRRNCIVEKQTGLEIQKDIKNAAELKRLLNQYNKNGLGFCGFTPEYVLKSARCSS